MLGYSALISSHPQAAPAAASLTALSSSDSDVSQSTIHSVYHQAALPRSLRRREGEGMGVGGVGDSQGNIVCVTSVHACP